MATAGDGLYEGLDWLSGQLGVRAVKKSVVEPVKETVNGAKEEGQKGLAYLRDLASKLRSMLPVFTRETISQPQQPSVPA